MADEKEEYSAPNEALSFVLAYLPLFELLSMTRVCKSLREAINNDILPWLKLVVDRPINCRLSDDILMEVASKAEARLQVLVLINCVKITDDGLLRVIAQNPHISKLHVPGCTSLSPGGVIKALMLLSKNSHRIKSLKIGGIYGVRKEDLETIQSLINHNQTQHKRNNIFCHEYKKFSTLKHIDTNCLVDLDVCPKCNEVRMVFDCPNVGCKKRQGSQCRGCEFCVTRCVECGICITESEELEEVSCSDTLCSDCWMKLPKCNFCNKPYCSQHADQQLRVSGSTGFVCAACHSKFY
ncbi:F-box protein SKIP28 [Sesamum angolense]|uniref:F-box protein SKIP28 n=1 Tax=Sesamum angolense TaxID=2727404 RepID=A0AAE1WVP2_9LAMI|nr:F-box protein SKIP28 [Sesamum angolense]